MMNKIIEAIDKYFYVQLCKMIDKNMTKLSQNNIIIFGAGIMGIEVSYVLKQYGLKVVAFSDNDSNKWGDIWGEERIISPNELGKIERPFIFLAMENYRECQEQLEKMGYILDDSLFVVSTQIKNRWLEDYNGQKGAEILWLGDCMMGGVALFEEDKESLSEKFSIDPSVKVLAKNNVYMRFYYIIFRMLLKDMKLRKVIIEFSVDMFGNKYHLFPANQQADILESICTMSDNRNEEVMEFLQVMREREKNHLLDESKPNRRPGSEEIRVQSIKNHFKMNYMFKIKEDNESVIYLSNFVKLCKENNIQCIAIIMPVNYEVGIRFFQSEFIDKYERNKGVICDCIQKNQGFVIDLSYQLQEKYFISIHSSNEGIYAEGRNIIYERVKNFM